MTRYAVRKTSTRFDYLERFCVVEISYNRVRRVKHTATNDREVAQEWADEMNAKLEVW
jgi:hypothetical protein